MTEHVDTGVVNRTRMCGYRSDVTGQECVVGDRCLTHSERVTLFGSQPVIGWNR